MKSPWKSFSLRGPREAIDLCNRTLVMEISQVYWQWCVLGFGKSDTWEARFCGTTSQKQLEIYNHRQVWTFSAVEGSVHFRGFINMTCMSQTLSSDDSQRVIIEWVQQLLKLWFLNNIKMYFPNEFFEADDCLRKYYFSEARSYDCSSYNTQVCMKHSGVVN